MSEANFTKLKWGIEKDEFDDSGEWFEIHASSEKHYISKHIADVYSGEGDAHLIAAAPEMYEAIEAALRIERLWTYDVCDEEHAAEAEALHSMRQKFIDALAKARGEA